jgi:hypothetical protein
VRPCLCHLPYQLVTAISLQPSVRFD